MTRLIDLISSGNVSIWDKIIIITFFVGYKHMPVPGKHKFITIYDIQDPDSHFLNTEPIAKAIADH